MEHSSYAVEGALVRATSDEVSVVRPSDRLASLRAVVEPRLPEQALDVELGKDQVFPGHDRVRPNFVGHLAHELGGIGRIDPVGDGRQGVAWVLTGVAGISSLENDGFTVQVVLFHVVPVGGVAESWIE